MKDCLFSHFQKAKNRQSGIQDDSSKASGLTPRDAPDQISLRHRLAKWHREAPDGRRFRGRGWAPSSKGRNKHGSFFCFQISLVFAWVRWWGLVDSTIQLRHSMMCL